MFEPWPAQRPASVLDRRPRLAELLGPAPEPAFGHPRGLGRSPVREPLIAESPTGHCACVALPTLQSRPDGECAHLGGAPAPLVPPGRGSDVRRPPAPPRDLLRFGARGNSLNRHQSQAIRSSEPVPAHIGPSSPE